MLTLEDIGGKKGPFRDARGRFRRRNWDELGMLGQAAARLAAQLAEDWKKDAALFDALTRMD